MRQGRESVKDRYLLWISGRVGETLGKGNHNQPLSLAKYSVAAKYFKEGGGPSGPVVGGNEEALHFVLHWQHGPQPPKPLPGSCQLDP